jgi:hypothetical protein
MGALFLGRGVRVYVSYDDVRPSPCELYVAAELGYAPLPSLVTITLLPHSAPIKLKLYACTEPSDRLRYRTVHIDTSNKYDLNQWHLELWFVDQIQVKASHPLAFLARRRHGGCLCLNPKRAKRIPHKDLHVLNLICGADGKI